MRHRVGFVDRYRQIPLTPLGEEAIAELLADLLGADPSIAARAFARRMTGSGLSSVVFIRPPCPEIWVG